MPRLSVLGDAAMGNGSGESSVNGAIPAALASSITGDPRWYDNETLVFQVSQTGSTLAPGLAFLNTTTGIVTVINSEGANRLAAGGSVWASFLALGDGEVLISYGATLTGAGLGDVGEDGTLATLTEYLTGGISTYTAAGVPQWSHAVALRYDIPTPVRSGLVAYCDAEKGWTLRSVLGAGTVTPYAARVDLPFWLVPITGVTGDVWVLEQVTTDGGNWLTLRKATDNKGYTVAYGTPTYQPDAREISPGVIRVCWSTDPTESAAALVVFDLTLATGVNSTATVSAGTLVWTVNVPIALEPIETVGGTGLSEGRKLVSNLMPMHEPMVGRDGRPTKPWIDYWQSLADGNARSIVFRESVPKAVQVPAFGTIGHGEDAPLYAKPDGKFSIESDSLDVVLEKVTQQVQLEVKNTGRVVIPGPEGEAGEPGVPGPPGPAGPAGATGASGVAGLGPVMMMGEDGEDGLTIPGPPGTSGAAASVAGADTQVQFNDAGVFGADATFTFQKTTDTLGVNNVVSQAATALSIAGAAGGAGNGSAVTLKGGDATANGAAGGAVTIAGGSVSGGTSMTAGSVTVKSGDVQANHGTVTVTTGASGSGSGGPSATQILIVPATQAASTAGTAFAGGGVAVKSGPGQGDGGSALGNGTAGDGGPLLLEAGIGGAETVAGNTRVGGIGGTVTVRAGDGGNAPGAGGTTNTGGAGGDVVLDPGTGGTGSTANGVAGGVKIPASYLQFTEMTAPAAGATNAVRVYAEDNGAGKTRLMALFATGAAQQIAIEP